MPASVPGRYTNGAQCLVISTRRRRRLLLRANSPRCRPGRSSYFPSVVLRNIGFPMICPPFVSRAAWLTPRPTCSGKVMFLYGRRERFQFQQSRQASPSVVAEFRQPRGRAGGAETRASRRVRCVRGCVPGVVTARAAEVLHRRRSALRSGAAVLRLGVAGIGLSNARRGSCHAKVGECYARTREWRLPPSLIAS